MQNVAQGTDVDIAQLVSDAADQMEQVCAKYKGWNE
jgi:hypothetical protein